VIAITSSPNKVEALRQAGADDVVVAPNLTFAKAVRELTGGEGADVVIEIVGAMTFEESLRALTPGGRLVIVGNLDTGIVQLNPGLTIVKELEIIGAYATTQEELAEALRLIEAGTLQASIADVLPLADAHHAHRQLEARQVAGRLVLAP
jgi:NADPH:quinone reductase-like Zn-dependent oxidoreductase